jgi:hypothetical protein
MIHVLKISNVCFFYYYFVCNLMYLMMLVTALRSSAKHQAELESTKIDWIKTTPLAPPITLGPCP